jgi:lysophospholipase L1-like esterase
MFGGSTMEGIGAIDDETIPSEFSRLINTTGTGVFRVENYGVSGYTFTQSVMKLVTLLQQGKHFDAVVFYDGANDIDYAYELGEAGALDGEDVAETRIEGGLVSRSALFVKEEMNACVLCMTAGIIARHTPVLQDHITPAIVRLRDAIHFKKGAASDQDPSRMADDIAEYYARTHALLSAIADAYQIPHLEFWQPSLMYDDAYGPGEASLALMDPRLTDPRLRSLYRHTRDDELARRLPDFHDLTHVLDRREKAVYVDAVHLVGDGNRQVARAMFEAWLAVPSRPAAHRPQ